MTELTADDYASIDKAGQTLHERGWRRSFSLSEMLGAWEQLVGRVEAGYEDYVDEYTNDLTTRDWLAAAWPMLTPAVRAARHSELLGLDERFRTATKDDGGAAIGRFFRVEAREGWWWRRVPIRREGLFARDLDGE